MGLSFIDNYARPNVKHLKGIQELFRTANSHAVNFHQIYTADCVAGKKY